MGMTRELMSQPTHFLSRPHTVLFSVLIHPSFSSQLFAAVGAGTDFWLLGITSPSPHSCLPSFLPLSPPLSPFLPRWSCSSCFIATMLPLHNKPQTQRWPQPQKVYFRLSHDHSHSHVESTLLFEDTLSSDCLRGQLKLHFPFMRSTLVKADVDVVSLVQRESVRVTSRHSWPLLCGETVQSGPYSPLFMKYQDNLSSHWHFR